MQHSPSDMGEICVNAQRKKRAEVFSSYMSGSSKMQ